MIPNAIKANDEKAYKTAPPINGKEISQIIKDYFLLKNLMEDKV